MAPESVSVEVPFEALVAAMASLSAEEKHRLMEILNEYRVRVGDYRVRYEVVDSSQQVFVLRVGHWKYVYRP